MKLCNNYIKNRSTQPKLIAITSSSRESKYNNVSEDPLPRIDFSNDNDNNNATNEVNSLETVEEYKEQKG